VGLTFESWRSFFADLMYPSRPPGSCESRSSACARSANCLSSERPSSRCPCPSSPSFAAIDSPPPRSRSAACCGAAPRHAADANVARSCAEPRSGSRALNAPAAANPHDVPASASASRTACRLMACSKDAKAAYKGP